MGGCTGCCNSCGGCGNCIELTAAEFEILGMLSQYAFLPVAQRPDSGDPVCVFDGSFDQATASSALQCLEKKGLIFLDYDAPLKGVSDPFYLSYPVRGSIAMTAKGLQILDLIEVQGIQ